MFSFENWFDTIQQIQDRFDHHPNQRPYDQTLKINYMWPFENLPRVEMGCRLFDVGCAYGSLSIGAKLLGYDVQAFDITEAYAPKGTFIDASIPFSTWDVFQPHPLAKASWEEKADVVVFTEVLEHLDFNPKIAVRNIRQIMKPGGRLILSTPRAEMKLHHTPDMKNTVTHWSSLPMKRPTEVPEDRHHHLYSTSQLVQLLNMNGFTIHKLSTDLWHGLHIGVVAFAS